MTNKSTYWIADAEGTKALVEGADQRDYWTKVRGWSEASEPEGLEFVWLRSDLLPDSAPTRLNWVAANDKAWTDNGFRPCPPPEPVNLALPPEHPSLCRKPARPSRRRPSPRPRVPPPRRPPPAATRRSR
jgi:hypothetical protein